MILKMITESLLWEHGFDILKMCGQGYGGPSNTWDRSMTLKYNFDGNESVCSIYHLVHSTSVLCSEREEIEDKIDKIMEMHDTALHNEMYTRKISSEE